jgi:hypothetical protein
VLVHVGRPQVGGVDRAQDGLNGSHGTCEFRQSTQHLA